VAEAADLPSRLVSLASALVTDRPWTYENDRRVLFLTCLLAGICAGGLEGAAISDPNLGIATVSGDASFWDTVASGAWMGAGAGAACGLALTATRNFWARVSLAIFLGVLLIPAALILSSKGRPLGHWEGEGYSIGQTLLEKPLGWGVYLGSALAGTMTVVAHLTRRCIERPRILFLTMIFGVLLGARSQAFFWEDWVFLSPPMQSCNNNHVRFSTIPGGVIATMTTIAGILILHQVKRRVPPRRLSHALGALIAVTSASLAWAVDAMPFTQPSAVVDLTFNTDGDQLITLHTGNAVRVWDVDEDRAGNALPPKEIGCWRFSKRRGWHAPLVLRYPYAAALVPGGVQVWQLPRMHELAFLRLDEEWKELALSPDARYLAVSRHEEARLFRMEWDDRARRLRFPEEFGIRGSSVKVYNLQTAGTFSVSDSGYCSFSTRRKPSRSGPLEIQRETLYGARNVISLADGTEILAAYGIDCSYLWNSGRVGGLMTFRPAMGPISWAVLSSDERLMALIGVADRWVIDLERGRVVLHDYRLKDVPEFVASSPDGDWIATVIGGKIETWKWPPLEQSR
jgi:hypothetical protein